MFSPWQRGSRGDGGGRRGRGDQGGKRGRGQQICRFFLQGNCRSGANCSYSHSLSSNLGQIPEEISEQQQKVKADYSSWKRLIKGPPKSNDNSTIERLWTGALTILNGDDRDWKQMLPRDLDDEKNYGREHMNTLLGMKLHAHGHGTFVTLVRPFLFVITHQALLDCLSVDTAVGGLYNFISGSNGTRAIPFFQLLSSSLEQTLGSTTPDSKATLEKTLLAMVRALRELLRREQRAAFHDDLPGLIHSIENLVGIADGHSVAFQMIRNSIAEIHGVIGRATGLLQQDREPQVDGVSTTVVTSTYPRDLVIPQNRHDNDKADITEIKILPTEDEIRSEHAEFLPSMDRDQPHFLLDQAERHLDSQFRLLRHDVLGEMSEAIGGIMVALEADPTFIQTPKLNIGNTRAHVNPQAHIRYVSFERRRGLEVQISFMQPSLLRKKSSSERRRWWEETKRLEEGVLIVLVSHHDAKSSLLFFTVSQKCTDATKDIGLSSNEHFATITARFTTRNQSDLEKLVRLSSSRTKGVLIEFPGAIPATFVPILESIQNMQRLSRLPFRQWILPDRIATCDDGSKVLSVPPPLYTRSPGFTFSISPILKNAGDDFSIDPSSEPDDNNTISELEKRTELDQGQCKALVAALTREFAFIQGPPGTGKSYLGVQLMRVLLACRRKVNLGPVVVVCYTNHALDQFLEHLIKVGIEKIVRIGGQSKSSILEGKNLRVVSRTESKTRSENYAVATAIEALDIQERKIKKILSALHGSQRRRDWANIKAYLLNTYPLIHRQFDRVDEDGFVAVGGEPFDNWARQQLTEQSDGASTDSIDQLLAQAVANVYSVPPHERSRLVAHWVESIRDEKSNALFDEVQAADLSQQQSTNVYDEVDRRVLQTADVIGVTTSGMAKRISALQHVKSKIVICEEAGEVMEPHMLSALLPSVEHFIQIGDHQQLRPQINNFKLSLESQQGLPYQLDRSQFERLSIGERGRPAFPVAQLNVQRRMRPQISALIRATIYPLLLDHDSTKNLPDVVGMRKNVFWLDHDNFEEGARADRQQSSHSNLWEVDMTHALVRHIVRQGIYSSTDIAVLTPYTGQLQKLRTKMRNDFEVVLSERDQETLMKEGFHIEETISEIDQTSGQPTVGMKPLEKRKMSELLRIATVDNFQGEEAKVVIVSLVRSNTERKVGFLKTTNRINVLLSRAQHGMYLIGNANTYSNISMWAQVQGMLQGADSLGKALGLCCPRHTHTEIQIVQPEDFPRLSPEGGCRLACDRRLEDCGHRCQARCHSESMHRIFSCPQPCERLHTPCRHNCQKQTCGEDCGRCLIRIDNVQLLCGHAKDNVSCYMTQDLKEIRCTFPVQKDVPECNHTVQVPCSRNVTSALFRCPTACNATLVCGHLCPGTCSSCQKEIDGERVVEHLPCSKICGRRFATCNHTCPRTCHDGKECGLCQAPCDVRCAHSKCALRCHQPCAPCVEDCTWSCEHHGSCRMPCAAPCTRLPCNQRCSGILSCAHQCPGICGEDCPEGYCQICSDKKDARVDVLEMKTYGDIDLNETPILVLGCGHFFTAETLDGHMGMAEVYVQDGYGDFTGVQDASDTLARSVPRCPDCRCPVRQHCAKRFNRVINRAVIDEMSKRFLVNGQADLRDMERQVVELELDLAGSREDIVKPLRQAAAHYTGQLTPAFAANVTRQLKERYARATKLEKAIRSFLNKIADKHQPAQKLHDATVNAMRRRPVEEILTDCNLADSVPPLARDRRITLGGRAVQLQAESIILDDRLLISQALKSKPTYTSIQFPWTAPEQQAKTFLESSKGFIDDCYTESLPKVAVEVSLCHAGTARCFESYSRATNTDTQHASQQVASAKEILANAQKQCTLGFQNANALLEAVEESLRLLGREWYEEVTAEEIAAIKKAMVGAGSGGIATHSGHWYNCANGHAFAIGECGMPMEQARCPECGAPIGGQSHRLVDGVTRAVDMEA